MLYTKKIIEYYNKIPDDIALWPKDQLDVISVQAGSHAAGELVIFQVKLDKHSKVIDSRYQVLGCGYMIALVVWLAETVQDKLLSTSLNVSLDQLCQLFQLPQTKHHCALTLMTLIEELENAC